MYANIGNLKGNIKWKNTYLNDDLSPEELRMKRNMLSLAAYCRSKGRRAKVVGQYFTLDNARYSYENLEKLPEDCQMKNIKTVKT